MRKISELLDSATCEAIDKWRDGGTDSEPRSVSISVSANQLWPVELALFVGDATGPAGYVCRSCHGGNGETLAEAWDIAIRRANGENIDSFGGEK